MLIPVQKNRVYENISAQIREQIKQGVWKEGERIQSELELAKLFQVSRGSIREAIKSLQMAGIVEAHSGSGTFVAQGALQKLQDDKLREMLGNSEYLDDVLQCRFIVESYTTRIASQIAAPNDIAFLRANFDKMMEYEKQGDFEGLNRTGIEFHAYIVRMLGNQVFSALYDSLVQPLLDERSDFFDGDESAELRQRGHIDHSALIDALEQHDEEKAEEIIETHLVRKLRKAENEKNGKTY